MKLIPYFDYCLQGKSGSMRTLYDLASDAETVICRVRRSKDGIPFICYESTLARLCLCDEQVSDLRFCEIDALLRLGNMHVLTLEKLLSSYAANAHIVLHFRGFRPDGDMLNRVVRDDRFSFGTDSPEQLGVISAGFPRHRTVGFASHLPAAERMVQAGASMLCLYGREPAAYTKEQLLPLTDRCEVWTEIPSFATSDLDSMVVSAAAVGCTGIVLPVHLIQ